MAHSRPQGDGLGPLERRGDGRRLSRVGRSGLQPALGVGTRGGQVFVYKSRDHTHVECDEMVLGTEGPGAFNEAERCGAAGIRAQSNALQGIVAGSAKPKKKGGGGFFSKLFKPRKKAADLQAESEARAAGVPRNGDEDTKVKSRVLMTKATIPPRTATCRKSNRPIRWLPSNLSNTERRRSHRARTGYCAARTTASRPCTMR